MLLEKVKRMIAINGMSKTGAMFNGKVSKREAMPERLQTVRNTAHATNAIAILLKFLCERNNRTNSQKNNIVRVIKPRPINVFIMFGFLTSTGAVKVGYDKNCYFRKNVGYTPVSFLNNLLKEDCWAIPTRRPTDDTSIPFFNSSFDFEIRTLFKNLCGGTPNTSLNALKK